MATPNGSMAEQQFAQVLQALQIMQSSGEREQKQQANNYLDQFQKTEEAWTFGHAILQSESVSVEGKMFAATTLRGKITYDLSQLPREQLPALRDSLLQLLLAYRTGARPIRTQLCVCLAGLALLMVEWKNVLELLLETLGNDALSSVVMLEFLKVLPEEVTEGRKVSLTEEEMEARSKELLTDSAPRVLQLLSSYAQATAGQTPNPALINCVNAWLKEIPVFDVLTSPLCDTVFAGLEFGDSFDEAVDCICSFFRETRDVDDNIQSIQILFPKLLVLQPKLSESAREEDAETFKALTRMFAEAGESWVVLAARRPDDFKPLVEAIALAAALDKERDAISQTFNFWYDLKNYLTLDIYADAHHKLRDIYAHLVEIMLSHLQYPKGDDLDLFKHDREAEEKFREFRHSMGDVLKDCCEVVGITHCLVTVTNRIDEWLKAFKGLAPDGSVPDWQGLEAPLFALRAMGRMITDGRSQSEEEEAILQPLMGKIVCLPEHDKLRFAITLVIGRYTEWTAKHPEQLDAQYQYILDGFVSKSSDVKKASAQALKFFGHDCGKHFTTAQIPKLVALFEACNGTLYPRSLEEVVDGIAHVVAAQPLDKIYECLNLFCSPILTHMRQLSLTAVTHDQKCDLADLVQLLTIFVEFVHPHVPAGQPSPLAYWEQLLPVVSGILDSFLDCLPVCERIAKFYKALLISFRAESISILPVLADKLATSFEKSHQGCFLWVSGTVVREFGDEELIDQSTRAAVYSFLEQQINTTFRFLDTTQPKEIPDVIEDFFRLATDGLVWHPWQLIPSQQLDTLVEAALATLELEQADPLNSVLQFLRDLVNFGRRTPPNSSYQATPQHIRDIVIALCIRKGERITQQILSGLMYTFPRDCVPDSSGVLLTLVELCPGEMVEWIKRTLEMLPAGSISPTEAQKFFNSIQSAAANKDWNKIRYTLRDFTAWYRRKNVAPRSEGVAFSGITGPRFHFGR